MNVAGPGTVRRGVRSDAAAITAIFLAARSAAMPYLPVLHSAEETGSFLEHFVLAQRELWVAESGGRVVGFAALGTDLLEHLYVEPASQGQGIGTTLLEWAQQRRPAGFGLYVFQRNHRARALYERHGFELVDLDDGTRSEEREPDAYYRWAP